MNIEESSIVIQEIRQLASWQLRGYYDGFLQLKFSCDVDDLSVRKVHQLRVSSRKLRANLNTFQVVFPTPDFKLIKDGFHDFTHQFAEIRDLDVLLEELIALIGQTGTFLQNDVMLKAVEKIRIKRKLLILQAVPQAATFFDGEASKLFSKFIQENQMVHPEKLPYSTYVREFIVESTRTKIFGFRSYENTLNANHFNGEFHQMRIALKNLRYTIDLFSWFDEQLFSSSIALFQSLQDHMGVIHDAVVWQKMIDPFLIEAEVLGEITSQKLIFSEGSSILKLYWQKRAAQQYQQFCKLYQDLKISGFWEEFDRSLANLRNLE